MWEARKARWLGVQSEYFDHEVRNVAISEAMLQRATVYQFKDIGLTISRGEKLGLIGANGCGKSTLMKILSGREAPDQGDSRTRKGSVIAYVEQEPQLPAGTVMDAIYQAASARVAQEGGSKGALQALERATERMNLEDAWDAEARAKIILQNLLPNVNPEGRTDGFSGGQRKRVALASSLLQKPDLLLLDEPTNHLDVECIEWLEAELKDSQSALILITHDRYFLERTCSSGILELSDGGLYRHPGRYSKYLENREQRLREAQTVAANAKRTLRKETEWMRRMPKARSTKSQARIDRYYSLLDVAASAPKEQKKLKLEGQSERLGGKALGIEAASFSFLDEDTGRRKNILQNFTYHFHPGERIGLVGRNGVGKSTVLNLLAGEIPLQTGIYDIGETVKIGYYKQQGLDPDDDTFLPAQSSNDPSIAATTPSSSLSSSSSAAKRIVDVVSDITGNQEDALKLMDRFNFERKRAFMQVARMSGGERRRLQLLCVLALRPNVLFLDEPSNDLDIPTLSALESFLTEEFKGSVVVVSHDRAFMDAVVDKHLVLEGDGKVALFQGTFSEYLDMEEQRKKASSHAEAAEKKKQQQQQQQQKEDGEGRRRRKLSYRETKEYEQLEEDIDSLSAEKEELEAILNSASHEGKEYGEVAEMAEKLAAMSEEIEQKTDRWLALAEILEGTS
eukprot:jgi/Bigna1/58475/fgenesh1_pm.96_\